MTSWNGLEGISWYCDEALPYPCILSQPPASSWCPAETADHSNFNSPDRLATSLWPCLKFLRGFQTALLTFPLQRLFTNPVLRRPLLKQSLFFTLILHEQKYCMCVKDRCKCDSMCSIQRLPLTGTWFWLWIFCCGNCFELNLETFSQAKNAITFI